MDWFLRDLRYAFRLLVTKPGFTALVLLTLGLGIGASTAMFTTLYHVVLRALPFGSPEELVFLNETSLDGRETYSVSIPNLFDWRERNRTFESLSGFRAANFNVSTAEGPARIRGAMVTGDFFETLDVSARLGEVFASDDERSVVLSYGLWQSRLGARRDVLGETMTIDGRIFTIRGVMPRDFEFLTSTIEMWLPIGVFETELPWNERGRHPALWVVARLADGATVEAARDDMARIAREIDSEFDHPTDVAVTPLHERSVERSRSSLLALMGAVALLLMIACVNVANLVLVRASGRAGEMATRVALGAGRGVLLRQLLAESLLFSGLGGLLGLLIGSWGVEILKTLLPDNTPRLATIDIDVTAVAFAAVISAVTAFVFALTPFVYREESMRARRHPRGTFRGALVVAEVALAGVLLVGAGLMVKSFLYLASVDAGFETDNRLAVRFDLTPSKYGTAERSVPFYLELLQHVRALPGVRSAAVSTGLPLVDPGIESSILREGLAPEQENFVLASFQCVSGDYFPTLGIRLIEGRGFDDRDRSSSSRVVVVDETLAARVFPGESAIGKRIYIDGGPDAPVFATIVGVVAHVRNYQLTSEQYVEVYAPLAQPPSWMASGFPPTSLVVRSASPPEAMFGAIRDVVARLDPNQPLYGMTTLDDVMRTALAPERTNSVVLTSFAVAALALAALGVYGVLSSLVGQKIPEIGIRMALGATPGSILRSVARDAVPMVALGILLGLGAAAALSRFIESEVYGVSALDPGVLATSVALLAGVAMLACAVPARRATRVQAVDALRHE